MITLESTAATDGSTLRETDHSGISRRIAERVEPMSQVQPVKAPQWYVLLISDWKAVAS